MMDVTFAVVQRNLEHGEFGQHSLTIDVGETGDNDAGQGDRNGDIVRYEVEIDESQWNTYAEFDVVGNGITLLPITSIDDEFYEPLFAYTVSCSLTLDVSTPVLVEVVQRLDGYTDLDPGTPSESYDPIHDGNLRMIRAVYDEARVLELDATPEETSSSGFSGLLLRIFAVVILLGVVAFWTIRRREIDMNPVLIDHADLEAEGAALEADLVSVGALKADD